MTGRVEPSAEDVAAVLREYRRFRARRDPFQAMDKVRAYAAEYYMIAAASGAGSNDVDQRRHLRRWISADNYRSRIVDGYGPLELGHRPWTRHERFWCTGKLCGAA